MLHIFDILHEDGMVVLGFFVDFIVSVGIVGCDTGVYVVGDDDTVDIAVCDAAVVVNCLNVDLTVLLDRVDVIDG